MARNYAQVYAGIWRDREFRDLPVDAQWTYLMLISQGDISSCGLLPLAPRRWAQYADGHDSEDIERAMKVLADRRFVLIDEDTVEVLVRSFVRWDGSKGNSKRVLAVLAAANSIVSMDLRAALAVELDRLDVPHNLVAEAPSPPRNQPRDDTSDSHPDALSGDHSGTPRVHVPDSDHSGPEPGTLNPEPGTMSVARRHDADPQVVNDLCEHLAERIERNGAKRPSVTLKWRTACRLMLAVDGRSPEQVRAAIDWCQNSEFWRANVLSMPKLRERYDQLSMQARRERTRPTAQQATDDMFERAAARMGVTT